MWPDVAFIIAKIGAYEFVSLENRENLFMKRQPMLNSETPRYLSAALVNAFLWAMAMKQRGAFGAFWITLVQAFEVQDHSVKFYIRPKGRIELYKCSRGEVAERRAKF